MDSIRRSNTQAEIQALVGRCGEAIARGRRGGLDLCRLSAMPARPFVR